MKTNPFTVGGRALVARARASEDPRESIARAVGAIGGLGKVVAPGDTILLKPNYNTADPPPGSSDPAFVAAVVALLYEHGAGKVIVGESSMFALSTRRTLHKAGLWQAATAAGAEVRVFDEWVELETGGRHLRRVGFARLVHEATKIVYVTCLKTHRLGEITMSLKLAVAMLRPRERLALHARRLNEKVAELNTLVTPDLIITDARRAFITGGPSSGEVREPGLVLASGDRIALDVEGVRIIQTYPGNSLAGKDPWQLTQIRHAVALGLGARGPEDYEVVDVPTLTPAQVG
ncbi:MAG: DUF362 domain-containing protein [Chloroflexota bacterium]